RPQHRRSRLCAGERPDRAGGPRSRAGGGREGAARLSRLSRGMEGSNPLAASGKAVSALSLPAKAYISEAFFAAEMEHIHRKHWFFVARADELASPGDYRAIDTVAGPVILLRAQAGTLRAFANPCRHRGSRLLSGCGSRRAIVCPYHGWGYRLDGALAGAPDMDQTPGFRPEENGPPPIRLETLAGLVFLTLHC